MAKNISRKRYESLTNKRINRLTKEGFLDFEIEVLKNIPISLPYLRNLRGHRDRWYKRSIKEGKSKRTFENEVERFYIDMGFTHPETNEFDIWQLIRDYEKRYKVKHPKYDSP